MKTLVDTAAMSAGDREEAVRHFYQGSAIRGARIALPAKMTNTLRLGVVGRFSLGIHAGTGHQPGLAATTFVQRARPRDVEDVLIVTLQRAGRFEMHQHGRTAVLSAGGVAVYDPAAPFVLSCPGDYAQATVRVPRAALGLNSKILDETTARPYSSADPLADLVRLYFTRLIENPDLRSGPHAEEVAESGVQLLRGLLATRADDHARAREPLQESLPARILAYVQAHLADRDLCAARIAAAHNISVRYLYVILAREGITLGDRIRSERLAAAYAELASANVRRRTIAAVAARWGFADTTHFSKVFRQTYGTTPRAWRTENQRAA